MWSQPDQPAFQPRGFEELHEHFQRAREDMKQLDDALRSLGLPPQPAKRMDRAHTPAPTFPVFSPTKLSY